MANTITKVAAGLKRTVSRISKASTRSSRAKRTKGANSGNETGSVGSGPTQSSRAPTPTVEDAVDEDNVVIIDPDEDEEYISKSSDGHQRSKTYSNIECVQPGWKAQIYAFYNPDVTIEYPKGRRAIAFECAGCKSKVFRYFDTQDSTSTSNLRTHVKKCKRWGEGVLTEVCATKDLDEARTMASSYTRTGTITKIFKCLGKGKLTFSTRQHRPQETR